MRTPRNDTAHRLRAGARRVLLPWLALPLAIVAACSTPAQRATEAERLESLEGLVEENRAAFPGVPTVDATELHRLLAEGTVVLVDAREPHERAVSMLPGALSLAEFEDRSAELEGAQVVSYCTVGHRSAELTRELRERGWDAANFAGSILAWTHAGGELIDADGRATRRLHVYGKPWDLAADGYATVW